MVIEYAGSIAKKEDFARTGRFVDECPILLQKVANLEPIISTRNVDSPTIGFHDEIFPLHKVNIQPKPKVSVGAPAASAPPTAGGLCLSGVRGIEAGPFRFVTIII